jgi:argininosuccinate synthase
MHQEQIWVREAVEGRWYQPLRAAAQAFILTVAERVSGTVTYDLSINKLQIRSLKADQPIYLRDRTEYERGPEAGVEEAVPVTPVAVKAH